MKLSEITESIFQGKYIEGNDLTSSPSEYLYLTPANLVGQAVTEEGAKYVTRGLSKKILKSECLQYGDILILPRQENDFAIFRFTQEFNKEIVPSPQFVVLRTNNTFLTNVLQQESGRSYMKVELQDLWKHKEGNWKSIVSELKNIDIPFMFEEGEITVSPGSIPIDKDDFAKIQIKKGTISTDNLIKRVNNKEIRVDGYFQRKSNLWDMGTKSRLIETIILEIPIPPLYFDAVTKNDWLVIDGLQRISAIVDFYNNKFQLEDLDFLPEFDGKRYQDLPRDLQRPIEEAELVSFSIQPGTPRSVRYKIFKNINTSSLTLNRQEIRHAMNDDENSTAFSPTKYMKELAEILIDFIKIPESFVDRMYDRELALRYVTFRMFFYKTDYRPSMADFLDKAVEGMYSYPKNKLEVYKTEFGPILDVLREIFGPNALFTRRMISGGQEEDEVRNAINGSLFETWTYAVGQLSFSQREMLLTKAKMVREKTHALGRDRSFLRSIDNDHLNSIQMVKIRFATIVNLVNEVLNDK